MQEIIRRLLPILILLAIGFFAKKTRLFSDGFINELKGLIVKIALPVLLFDAFSSISFQTSYLLLFVIVFLYCGVLYQVGKLLPKIFPTVFQWKHANAFMTGFEFGMIGVGLFGAIWGIDKLPLLMLLGFGHEIFVWFFYVQGISRSEDSLFSLKGSIKQIFKTPTIIAIILGVAFNLLGIRPMMNDYVIGQSLLAVIAFLKPLTSPLILIVIGYTMVFDRSHIREAAAYIVARLVLTLALGSLALMAIMHWVPDLDKYFIQAFYAFVLLPAAYVLPLYLKNQEEAAFFTQLLVYSTAVSFLGYAFLVALSF